ncbi:hypothetical protein RvY_09912 [Ramazzottius varieornatus]|uniref:Uncharacterized protein n=1 Tax=Ramazzottius varieornatus TaxID=947166 RepID=A0A1D1VB09_RAMVA|nr:hypothetical protein RvY_09912 [Ramazzottius varieornatus]
MAATNNFNLRITYMADVDNLIAYAVSRCNWEQFLALYPTASEEAVRVDCDLEFLKRVLQSDHVPRSKDSTVSRDGSLINILQIPHEEFMMLDFDTTCLSV